MASVNKPKNFLIILLPDVLLLYLSLWLTVQIRYGGGLSPLVWLNHLRLFSLIYLVWAVIFFIHGLFDFSSLRRYTSLVFSAWFPP